MSVRPRGVPQSQVLSQVSGSMLFPDVPQSQVISSFTSGLRSFQGVTPVLARGGTQVTLIISKLCLSFKDKCEIVSDCCLIVTDCCSSITAC